MTGQFFGANGPQFNFFERTKFCLDIFDIVYGWVCTKCQVSIIFPIVCWLGTDIRIEKYVSKYRNIPYQLRASRRFENPNNLQINVEFIFYKKKLWLLFENKNRIFMVKINTKPISNDSATTFCLYVLNVILVYALFIVRCS